MYFILHQDHNRVTYKKYLGKLPDYPTYGIRGNRTTSFDGLADKKVFYCIAGGPTYGWTTASNIFIKNCPRKNKCKSVT